MAEETQYSELDDEDVKDTQRNDTKPHSNLFIWCRLGHAPALLLASTVLLLFMWATVGQISRGLASKHTSVLEFNNCGNTPEEARASGCTFDLMSWCWLPPACHDETLSTEHLEYGPWKWYEDQQATRPVDQAVAALGEIELLWVERSFHQVHCAYVWKKMHRAFLGQGTIDSYIGGFNHTIHCSEILLRRNFSWTKVDTYVWLKYPTCDDIRSLWM